ncbi:hypothetical protein [Paenibacillus sp. FSL H7-0331]|uniref:hypothetical protein n=1 Tax=Paenibacillus sp. FSL H7-0331 TaxID=1920421 RepID=UPI00096ED5C1|nr:hypothetical protein [Paenibacillus sp. FSL H7-0331]OMF14562.1 hypothetical protein BK127_17740 [Paenibacillus sp. FSL H7-0331]
MTFDKMTSLSLCIVVLIVITGIILVVMKRQRKNQNPFAVHAKNPSRKQRQTDSSGKPSSQQQSCSYCKRKVNPKELAFYSGHEKVVGVCKTCRPIAERQSLLRL